MAQARQVPDSSRHWYPGMGARSSARPSPPLGRRGVPKGWACSPAAQVTITCGDKDPTPGGQILFPLKEAGPQRPHSGVTRPPGAQPGLTSCSSAHHHERPRSPRGRQPFRCAGTKTKDTTGSFLQISGLGQPHVASWKPHRGDLEAACCSSGGVGHRPLVWGLRRVSQAKAWDEFQGREPHTSQGGLLLQGCWGTYGCSRAPAGNPQRGGPQKIPSQPGPPPSRPWGPATDTEGGGKAPLSCWTGRALMRNRTPGAPGGPGLVRSLEGRGCVGAGITGFLSLQSGSPRNFHFFCSSQLDWTSCHEDSST